MEYVIDFKKNTPTVDIENYLNSNGLTVLEVYDNFELVYLVNGTVTPPHNNLIDSIVENSDKIVKLMEYDLEVSKPLRENADFSISDDSNWWKTYSLQAINFDQEQLNYERAGKNIKIYLLDSGIKDDHPEFENANINKLFSFTGNFNDTTGHGTALASLIVGKNCGLTNSTLCVVKIFDKDLPTKLSDLLNALNQVFGDFLNNPNIGAIVNTSWSIPKNIYVEQKLQTLIDAGMTVVTAAGNNGISIENVTPACMNSVITVGAYNQNFLPCDFSNYTASETSLTQEPTNYGELDGWAPGIDIRAASLNGSYNMIAGTSASAAIASSALAYNLEKYLTVSEDFLIPPSEFQFIIPRDLMIGYTFSRNGLLTLEGNYISSKNLVVTFSNKYDSHNLTTSLIKLVHFKNNQDNFQLLFPVDNVLSIKLSDSLPEGMYFYNGYLTGRSANVTFNEHNYYYKNIFLTLTTDTGEEKILDLRIFVTNGIDNLSQLTVQDETLAITLTQTCEGDCVDTCTAFARLCVSCPAMIKGTYCFCDIIQQFPCGTP